LVDEAGISDEPYEVDIVSELDSVIQSVHDGA
jgi:hypothetical protein